MPDRKLMIYIPIILSTNVPLCVSERYLSDFDAQKKSRCQLVYNSKALSMVRNLFSAFRENTFDHRCYCNCADRRRLPFHEASHFKS